MGVHVCIFFEEINKFVKLKIVEILILLFYYLTILRFLLKESILKSEIFSKLELWRVILWN